LDSVSALVEHDSIFIQALPLKWGWL